MSRRFFQLRLRTALLALTVCAVACGWLGTNLRQWQVEQQVLTALSPAAIELSPPPQWKIFC